MIFRRRFADVVRRQLALFAADQSSLIAACDGAVRAYDRAPTGEAEERYGDYLDLVETATELLVEAREAYAGTLGADAADEYRAVFNRAALKRFPRFALELEDS